LGISTTRNVPNYTPSNVSVNDFFVTNPTKVFTYFGSISLSFSHVSTQKVIDFPGLPAYYAASNL
jgi:hypothetical protein